MQNPYQTLGVNRDATADEIKRAYRKLASKHHPDRGGDTKKFQEIQQAYDSLTNPQRQAGFQHPHGQGFGFGANGPFDFQTIFDIFGTRFQHAGQQRVQQARMSLWVTLKDVAQQAKRTISIGTDSGTTAAEIEIPPGINDGDTVQYSGIAPGGIDLVITFRIHPDAKFQRQGSSLICEHTVTVWDLILGAEITVRDILGTNLTLSIPPRTQPGTTFRLRGRGLAQMNGPTGDLLVRVQAQIPEVIDTELLEHIQRLQGQ